METQTTARDTQTIDSSDREFYDSSLIPIFDLACSIDDANGARGREIK